MSCNEKKKKNTKSSNWNQSSTVKIETLEVRKKQFTHSAARFHAKKKNHLIQSIHSIELINKTSIQTSVQTSFELSIPPTQHKSALMWMEQPEKYCANCVGR